MLVLKRGAVCHLHKITAWWCQSQACPDCTQSGFKVLTSLRFQYLEVQLIHMPGLRQRSPKLEHVSHTIPGKKCWARKELLNLWLVQSQSSVYLQQGHSKMINNFHKIKIWDMYHKEVFVYIWDTSYTFRMYLLPQGFLASKSQG